MSRWWSSHVHSHYSSLDGTTDIPAIVARAAEYGYPALGLSDHGNIAGATHFYKECKAAGIKPFIGIEAYLVDPAYTGAMDDKEFGAAGRFHMGIYARNIRGYRALVKLTSLSHTRPRFNRFARITWDDLVDLSTYAGDDVIVTTGCYFGFIQQTLVNDGFDAAMRATRAMSSLFPHTFVEVQHHNIDHSTTGDAASNWDDGMIVDHLIAIADELELPVMATQDSHYLNARDKSAHGLMKKMTYGGADDGFPGDSFHLASEDWVADHYTDAQWSRCLDGAKDFLDLHDLEIPLLDTFVPQVPKVVDDAETYIRQTATAALMTYIAKMSRAKQDKYLDRIAHELDVINALGMSGYFAIVEDYVKWCRTNNICIEARGSANASLVCQMLGITSVDPVEWDLMFERFLSVDRTKPPDVDMDVEAEQHGNLINYLLDKYGARRIGTFMNLGESKGKDGEYSGKGSILVTYRSSLMRKATDPQERAAIVARTQNLDDVAIHDPDSYDGLKRLAAMGVYRSYGVHPGGLLLPGEGVDVDDWIPTMLVASSNTPVTQYDMHAVEEWGLLKVDILSQQSLTVLKLCQEMLGKTNPCDFTWIPKNDNEACKVLREGRMDNGVFHYEGYTKAKGGKELGIKSTRDAVLATALYMPGATESGQKDLLLGRRRNKDERDNIAWIHPVFEKHLAETYGAVVYQEQVMGIWIDLGMSVKSANAVLKVMKSSGKHGSQNAAKVAALRNEFEERCAVHGIADTQAAWDGTAGFASYGFNKAHSAGYGIRSYRCAYLKAHHPLEYMAALLMVWAGTDKEANYVKEARRLGVRVVPADVNLSGKSWRLETGRNRVRRGLLSLPGLGPAACDELVSKAPFRDIDHLATSVNAKAVSGGKAYITTGEFTGALNKLRQAGALRSLGIDKEEL